MLDEVGAAVAGTHGRLSATSASAFSASTDGWGAREDFTRTEGWRVAQSDREATEPGVLSDLAGGACQRFSEPISGLASRATGDDNGAAPEAGEAGTQSTAACDGGAVAGAALPSAGPRSRLPIASSSSILTMPRCICLTRPPIVRCSSRPVEHSARNSQRICERDADAGTLHAGRTVNRSATRDDLDRRTVP